jgi:hypothetical protein
MDLFAEPSPTAQVGELVEMFLLGSERPEGEAVEADEFATHQMAATILAKAQLYQGVQATLRARLTAEAAASHPGACMLQTAITAMAVGCWPDDLGVNDRATMILGYAQTHYELIHHSPPSEEASNYLWANLRNTLEPPNARQLDEHLGDLGETAWWLAMYVTRWHIHIHVPLLEVTPSMKSLSGTIRRLVWQFERVLTTDRRTMLVEGMVGQIYAWLKEERHTPERVTRAMGTELRMALEPLAIGPPERL